jgi:hypothetical protein
MVTRRTLLIVTGAALCSAAILVTFLLVYESVIPPITRPDPNRRVTIFPLLWRRCNWCANAYDLHAIWIS